MKMEIFLLRKSDLNPFLYTRIYNISIPDDARDEFAVN